MGNFNVRWEPREARFPLENYFGSNCSRRAHQRNHLHMEGCDTPEMVSVLALNLSIGDSAVERVTRG
jgi:hypothetical protein